MDHAAQSGTTTRGAPDHPDQNPLDADSAPSDSGRYRPQTGEAHDPGPGLLTNPLDKSGAKDNLIKNPLDTK